MRKDYGNPTILGADELTKNLRGDESVRELAELRERILEMDRVQSEACWMLEKGMDIKEVAGVTGLDTDLIEKLKQIYNIKTKI